MADQNSSGIIPDGWILKNEVQKDGSNFSHYFCEATGQLFHTYEDLMRYVKYAKEARVSIFSTEFKVQILKKKADFLAKRKSLNKKARSKHLAGQSLRLLAIKRCKALLAMRKGLLGQSSKSLAVDQGNEIDDLAESTGLKDSTGLGESAKADCPHQAGQDGEQVPNLHSSDLASN